MTCISNALDLANWTKKLSIATCIAIAVTANASPPPLVQNGSFEDPSLPVGGFLIQNAGTGWSSAYTSAPGPGVWENGYLGFLRPPAIDGHQVLWMPSGTSAWQTISLQAGTFYDLSFYVSPAQFTSVLPNITLTLTDSTNFTPINITWGTSSPGAWTLDSIGFIPLTTDNFTMKFTLENTLANDSGFGMAFLDDVTLTARQSQHVPDAPATALLVGLGAIAVHASRRKFVTKRRA